MTKPTSIDDCVYACMKNGQWWTFWELQDVISEHHKFYGEPTISASIRNLRKYDRRVKYGLPLVGQVVLRKRIPDGKGNLYKLVT